MKFSQEAADQYLGGQVEIQNEVDGYLYRGKVEVARITGSVLKVNLAWMACGEGYPPLPRRWVNVPDLLEYIVDMENCTVSDIGGGRLNIHSFFTGELATFFTPEDGPLDPAQVEGLSCNPA
jgi:hypothetical protein